MAEFAKLSFPKFKQLGWSQLSDEEEKGLSEVAAKQVEDERVGSNWFFDFIDTLQKPQRAIANMALDLVDGGTFNPLDRTIDALTGTAQTGFGDVLNEIFPDRWSRGNMPSWLGGKDVDWAKEGLGFIADILTDPLAYFQFGVKAAKVMGKPVRKVMGAELGIFVDEVVPKSKLWRSFKRGETEAMDKGRLADIGAPHPSLLDAKAAAVRTRHQTAYQYRLMTEAIENPAAYTDDPAMTQWLESFKNQTLIGPHENVWQQMEEGKKLFAQLKVPFTNISINMLPFANEQIGKGMAELTKGMWHTQYKMPAVKKLVDLLGKTFIYSTGNRVLDNFIHKSLKNAGADKEQFKGYVQELVKLFPANAGKKFTEETLDLIERPYELFGYAQRTNVDPEQLAVAQKVWDFMKEIGQRERDMGLQRRLLRWGDPMSLKKSWHNARDQLETYHRKWADTAFDPATYWKHTRRNWSDVTDRVDRTIARYMRMGAKISGAEEKALKKKLLDGSVVRDLRRAKEVLGHGNTKLIEGYFPRFKSEIAVKLMGEFMEIDSVMFGKTQAHKFFSDRVLERKFKEMTVKEVNEMFASGNTPYNFMNDVIQQVQLLAKNNPKLNRKLHKFYKAMGADQFLFFENNPITAVMSRGLESIRTTNNAQFVGSALRAFGRPLDHLQPNVGLGEKAILPTPFGMQAMYGKGWRRNMTQGQLEYYNSLLKNSRHSQNMRLDEAFVNMDAFDIADAHKAGLPMLSLNADVYADLNKTVQFRTSPREMNEWIGMIHGITQWFKATSLAPFPGYHARNFMGQFWLGYLGGSVDLTRPVWTAQNFVMAAKFMYGANLRSATPWSKGRMFAMKDYLKKGANMGSLDDLKIANDAGEIVGDGKLLADIFNQDGIAMQSFYNSEFQSRLAELPAHKAKTLGEKIKKATGAGLREFSHKGKVIQGLFETGSWIESWQRMAQVIAGLRKGESRFEAVANMKKYFHAFDELTPIENNVLSEAIPFYNWTRHNIPLQAQQAILQPHKFAQMGRVIEFLQSEEGKNMDRRKLPRWVNENYGVPMRTNPETGDMEVSILKSWVPAMDLMMLTTRNPIASTLDDLGGMLNPIVKLPIEAMTGTNLFTKRPIEEFPGHPTKFLGTTMPKWSAHSLKSFRALSEIDKAFRPGDSSGKLDTTQRVANIMGLTPKFKAFNVESLNKRLTFDRNQRTATLKRLYGKAKRDGDKGAEEYYRRLWDDARGYVPAKTKK